jgi:hypothetical protein
MIYQHHFIVGKKILAAARTRDSLRFVLRVWFWRFLDNLISGLFIAQFSATVAGEYFHIAPDNVAGHIPESPPVFGVVPSNPALACE